MTNNDILLDSDVIIWILRGRAEYIEKFKFLFENGLIFTTPISVAEIFAGARPNEEKVINNFFQSIEVLQIDQKTGMNAGNYMNQFSHSHKIEIADALIGASTLIHKLKLWTLNKKHYPMISEDLFI